MKTQAQLEIENAELRGQVTELRKMCEMLLTRPAPTPALQFIPCTLPHYPPPMPTYTPFENIKVIPEPFRYIPDHMVWGSGAQQPYPFTSITCCAPPLPAPMLHTTLHVKSSS